MIRFTQYNTQLQKLKAAVDAASDYGTYVSTHVYIPEAMQRAIAAGVKSFEHGFLIDEPTMKQMVEKGIFLSTQLHGLSPETLKNPLWTPTYIAKAEQMLNESSNFVPLIKKYHPENGFCVRCSWSP